jgi:hypothetical protein
MVPRSCFFVENLRIQILKHILYLKYIASSVFKELYLIFKCVQCLIFYQIINIIPGVICLT